MSKTSEQLEQRVETLETEVALLKNHLKTASLPNKPWWEKISGTFADNSAYDEAMQLGREYRQSKDLDVEESQ